MYKLECARKNETHKILWEFEIQTDLLILARRPDLVIISKKKKKKKVVVEEKEKKRTCRIVDFADHKVQMIENEKRDKYLDLA